MTNTELAECLAWIHSVWNKISDFSDPNRPVNIKALKQLVKTPEVARYRALLNRDSKPEPSLGDQYNIDTSLTSWWNPMGVKNTKVALWWATYGAYKNLATITNVRYTETFLGKIYSVMEELEAINYIRNNIQ